jgi:hypothetical protein
VQAAAGPQEIPAAEWHKDRPTNTSVDEWEAIRPKGVSPEEWEKRRPKAISDAEWESRIHAEDMCRHCGLGVHANKDEKPVKRT